MGPLSLIRGDGEKLVRLAAERQKTLFVGHILHYHAAVIRLKKIIKAGEIGRLQYIYSRRLSLGKIRRALMVGNPAKQIGWMCECGEKLDATKTCPVCGKRIFGRSQRCPYKHLPLPRF
jgi:hypothetical protein